MLPGLRPRSDGGAGAFSADLDWLRLADPHARGDADVDPYGLPAAQRHALAHGNCHVHTHTHVNVHGHAYPHAHAHAYANPGAAASGDRARAGPGRSGTLCCRPRQHHSALSR